MFGQSLIPEALAKTDQTDLKEELVLSEKFLFPLLSAPSPPAASDQRRSKVESKENVKII